MDFIFYLSLIYIFGEIMLQKLIKSDINDENSVIAIFYQKYLIICIAFSK
jgi:hypothetical protein